METTRCSWYYRAVGLKTVDFFPWSTKGVALPFSNRAYLPGVMHPSTSAGCITPLHWIKRGAASSCHRGWQFPAVNECIAQVSTAQLRPTISSPVCCTPATVLPIHCCNASSLDQARSCFVLPPRLAVPCGKRVHCTGLNSPTPSHDQLTCALHSRRDAIHSLL